jgi:TonB family protein
MHDQPDREGRPGKAAPGHPAPDRAALEAVKQWEYTPTELNGVAVPVIMTVTVNFKLS